jgi:hypothetical protein
MEYAAVNANIFEGQRFDNTSSLREKRRSYTQFTNLLHYFALGMLVIASLLILALCTTAGWTASLFVAAIELTLGIYFAKRRLGGSWQAEIANVVVATEIESGHQIVGGAEVYAPWPSSNEVEALDRSRTPTPRQQAL